MCNSERTIKLLTTAHRLFLLLLVMGLLSYLAWYDIQPAVEFTFTPNETRLLTKRNNSPADSPIVHFEGKDVWLLNQPSTHFELEMTDIFETITIRAHYQTPTPKQIVIATDRSRTLPLIDPAEISLLQQLNDPDWPWTGQTSALANNLTFYAKPGLPEGFPSFETFVQENIPGIQTGTTERIFNNGEVFVVKNDQNIEYRPLAGRFDLPYIAYLLVPQVDALEFVDAVQLVDNSSYVLELRETLSEEERQLGGKLNFRLNLSDYVSGDWAVVEKISIIAARQPVTFEGVVNFMKKVF
ncbi:hypothetical protein KKB83_05385 [Patescibacteria group bacterium]|nr:hypothetical protein [Patescibacteria group bacterium]